MRVAFRADASLEIGTGHVMRCLTLAEALRKEGAEVSFISRDLPGNMIECVEAKGIPAKRLPPPHGMAPEGPPAHATWAGVPWQRDAKETAAALEASVPDWLVVDHYAFDERWEKAIRDGQLKLMVIDDLADRPHDCHILLDQNLGREAADYEGLVPDRCKCLIGPRYALLRPEFAAQRHGSLHRRLRPAVEHILISMGGVDQDNVTGRMLELLQEAELPANCRLTVVLGESAPWFDEVRTLADASKVPTTILRNVEDMATLMSEADLAIGGAGSTSWERCCLGLPSLLWILAANQEPAAKALARVGAAVVINSEQSVPEKLQEFLDLSIFTRHLKSISTRSASLVDGGGAARVAECLELAR